MLQHHFITVADEVQNYRYMLKPTKLAISAKMVRMMPKVYPGLSNGIFMPVPGILGTKSPPLSFSIVNEYALTYPNLLRAASSCFFLACLRYS